MKESRFFRLSLLLPLALPALLAPLMFVDSYLPKWMAAAAIFMIYSGLLGGIPYLVLVGLLFWWARKKSDIQFKRALVFLPIFMVPTFSLILGLSLLVEASLRPAYALSVSQWFVMSLVLVPFILGFGYFYVLLVFGMAWVLRRRGMLVTVPAY
jgi:hypothetical protein